MSYLYTIITKSIWDGFVDIYSTWIGLNSLQLVQIGFVSSCNRMKLFLLHVIFVHLNFGLLKRSFFYLDSKHSKMLSSPFSNLVLSLHHCSKINLPCALKLSRIITFLLIRHKLGMEKELKLEKVGCEKIT